MHCRVRTAAGNDVPLLWDDAVGRLRSRVSPQGAELRPRRTGGWRLARQTFPDAARPAGHGVVRHADGVLALRGVARPAGHGVVRHANGVLALRGVARTAGHDVARPADG